MAYRYLGNKTRLTEWIVDVIKRSVPPGASIADPMCGTAAVSEALANSGYNVQASDALTFPVLHASARLLLNAPPPFEFLGGYDSALARLNAEKPREGYFFREFSPGGKPAYGGLPRSYFTSSNATKIDAVRSRIREMRIKQQITPIEHTLLLHDLTLAVNDVANITGTYGYFRSTWNEQALSPLLLTPEAFNSTTGVHTVFQANAHVALEQFSGEAVYIDPPYTKRQYSGNYHILETLAVGDEPVANGAGGLRDWKHQASDFCYRRRAPSAFISVLESTHAPHIFVSYSEDGQLAPDELLRILSRYGTVSRYDCSLARFRSNKHTAKQPVTEHLYHVER